MAGGRGRPRDAAGRERRLLMAAGALLALMLAALLAWLVGDTLALVHAVGVNPVLFGFDWHPAARRFGLMPFIWGTVAVAVIALVGAVPLGLALGVLTVRRLPSVAKRTLLAVLPVGVAIPSVIYGWWGLVVMVPVVRRLSDGPGFSVLAAGLTLAVMIIPTLAVLGAEAVGAVPRSLEEASRALGATEDDTLWLVTLPAAGAGLMRAVILAAGRAVAETMAVQMVIGSAPVASLRLTDPGATLTTGILTHLALYPPGSLGSDALSAMALLLLVGTWILGRELRAWEAVR